MEETWVFSRHNKKPRFEASLSKSIEIQNNKKKILTNEKNLYSKSSKVAKDKNMEGDDLRQTGDFNDLQSTCKALKSENDTLRAELESAHDKVKEQAIKIEMLTEEESVKKLKKIEEANLKAEIMQRNKGTQPNFVDLINEVTPKDVVESIDGNSSGDSTIDMKLMEKNVSV